MPVCPLCDQPVPVKRGEDPNIRVSDCQVSRASTVTCATIKHCGTSVRRIHRHACWDTFPLCLCDKMTVLSHCVGSSAI